MIICKLTQGLDESLLFKVEDPDILGFLVIDKVVEVIDKIARLAPTPSLDDASSLTILEKDAEGFLGVVSLKQDFIDLGQTPTRTLDDSELPDQWGICGLFAIVRGLKLLHVGFMHGQHKLRMYVAGPPVVPGGKLAPFHQLGMCLHRKQPACPLLQASLQIKEHDFVPRVEDRETLIL